jgi:predicted transcriptional regulator
MLAEHKSEFEVPPRTKIRVVATVEKALCEECERIHEEEVALAKREDRNEPEWSNTLEMLLRKGVRTYKEDVNRRSSKVAIRG